VFDTLLTLGIGTAVNLGKLLAEGMGAGAEILMGSAARPDDAKARGFIQMIRDFLGEDASRDVVEKVEQMLKDGAYFDSLQKNPDKLALISKDTNSTIHLDFTKAGPHGNPHVQIDKLKNQKIRIFRDNFRDLSSEANKFPEYKGYVEIQRPIRPTQD
jgi:hypothetical protein